MSGSLEDARKDVAGTNTCTNVLLIVSLIVAMVPVVKLIELLHWVIDR